MTDRAAFAEWLQKELSSKGWSQADMARASGLSRQAISKYINQERTMPDKKAVEAIAHALGYPPETILRAAGALPGVDPDDERFAIWKAKIRMLSPGAWEMLLKQVDAVIEHEQKQKEKNA